MIPLKSEQELVLMRQGGKILAGILESLSKSIRSGISTLEIDRIAEDLMRQAKVESAFKGYKGYPACICISVNEEIVHGIPSQRLLKDKDIVSLDIGIYHQGYFTDAATTVSIGKIDRSSKRLIDVTKRALSEGIKKAKPGNRLTDISYSIQNYVEKNGFSVVREFVGHGIGRSLHEEPEIPNFGRPGEGPILKNGMVLAIEPMVNMGSWESEILDNGWTAVTKDRLASAHFEHTVAITSKGNEILTSS
jgi:methionyl aminopeptidase